ncbi:LytTR family DNA-binding domain-containing protein [Maritalea sp.]|uniref:LytTR family DNA-binding domain-containing protein n=1 Tax=Maritalea sp. TaxID=2003361 RepID=UPI003EF98880
MIGNALQLALRETRTMFTTAKPLTAMLILGIMLGLVGPFATFDIFRPLPRIAYWLGMVFLGYAAGSFGGGFVVNLILQKYKNPNVWLMIICSGIGSGILVSLVVYVVNSAILGDWELKGFSGILTAVYCILISICVAALHVLFVREHNPETPQQIELLARLQVQNRGPLLYLSMQDHYVNVVTARGSELILMRMSDALKETTGINGLKIHRSHWIALDGIKRVVKKGGNYAVEMQDDTQLPISRGQIQAARDAGIIT